MRQDGSKTAKERRSERPESARTHLRPKKKRSSRKTRRDGWKPFTWRDRLEGPETRDTKHHIPPLTHKIPLKGVSE
jgi:hypothetical protein